MRFGVTFYYFIKTHTHQRTTTNDNEKKRKKNVSSSFSYEHRKISKKKADVFFDMENDEVIEKTSN